MDQTDRAVAKPIFDEADYKTANRIYDEFVRSAAGEERANILVAIAFLLSCVSEDEDGQVSETTISAVAELAWVSLPHQKQHREKMRRNVNA